MTIKERRRQRKTRDRVKLPTTRGGWPSTKYHVPFGGKRETARRLKQITAGRLAVSA